MNSCWILLPEDGVLTVRNGDAPEVRVVVSRGLHPTIVQNGTHVYPHAWEGFIWHGGTIEHWHYPSGPVKEVRVRKNNDGRVWVLAIWK